MKFFNFPISNYPFEYSVYPDDVQDTPEPSLLLYFLYSIPHSQLPKNVDPNTVYPVKEIPAEVVATSCPSISLPSHSYLWMADTQYRHVHDLYLQPPLVSVHSLHYRFEQPNPYTVPEHRPLIHDNDTSLPILYERLIDLQNVYYDDIHPYCKSKKFVETKVTAINCRVFNLFLR